MSNKFYNDWKDDKWLPIECLINTMLLCKGYRDIVQFDITYYDTLNARERIQEFANSCKNVIQQQDSRGNIVMYLREKQKQIERKLLKIGNDDIHNAFRTSEFADMLDSNFYTLKGPFPSIFKKNRIVQVSINVIHPSGRTGSLLIQMSNKQISPKIPKVYKHFMKLSKQIEEIDSSLQTSFTFHTKPGLWRESPEMVVAKYKKLPT